MSTTPEETAAPDAMGRFRKWAAIAVAVAAIGYLAYALYRGLSETANELVSFSWGWYLPILGLTLVNYGLRYLKWHYLLGRLGVRIPHSSNIWIYLAGLAMVISPAKAGEVVKPYLVKVMTGAPMARTLPALVAERGTDGLAVVILSAIGVSTFYAEAQSVIVWTFVAIVAMLGIIASKTLSMGIIRIVESLPVVGGIGQRLEESYLAMRTCLAPVPFMVTIVMSLVAWWAECVGYWLVFKGMSVSAGLDVSTFLYAFSTVFGAPSPGGMGMADVALVEGARELIAGLTDGQAVASSLLIRIATLWFGVLLGAGALLYMERVIKRHADPSEAIEK